MDCSLPGSPVHPGRNTGVGCHFLLQGMFLTQGLNPGLLHCRQTPYHLSHQGSSISLWRKQTENIASSQIVAPYDRILCSYQQEHSYSFCTNMERVLRSVGREKARENMYISVCFCINSRGLYKELHAVVVFGLEEGNEANGRQR